MILIWKFPKVYLFTDDSKNDVELFRYEITKNLGVTSFGTFLQCMAK